MDTLYCTTVSMSRRVIQRFKRRGAAPSQLRGGGVVAVPSWSAFGTHLADDFLRVTPTRVVGSCHAKRSGDRDSSPSLPGRSSLLRDLCAPYTRGFGSLFLAEGSSESVSLAEGSSESVGVQSSASAQFFNLVLCSSAFPWFCQPYFVSVLVMGRSRLQARESAA